MGTTMSQGTLYANHRIRTVLPAALVQHYKLDVNVVEPPSNYAEKFPLGKVPAFAGEKGFKLTETIAITLYLINFADPKSPLLGKNAKEYALILKWLSLSNSELLPQISAAFTRLTGAAPYNKKIVDDALAQADKVAAIYESRLADFTYLVGERLSLADLFSAVHFVRGFDHLFGSEWRKQFPNITRWFKTVISHPILHAKIGDYKFREKPVEYVAPKKEKKPQAPKADKKADDEEPPAQAPKPKHPLAALGAPKIPIDEWKRTVSNNKPEVALKYFWDEFYNDEDWSLWKVDYKYNDELTLTFMSNNLVGGFFARLTGSTKFMYGDLVVYGENNDNGITGFFLVRGQDYVPAVNVAPDWESYSYSKLDPKDPETKTFIEKMINWEGDIVAEDGKTKAIVDGKELK